jgi:hypothetical protein
MNLAGELVVSRAPPRRVGGLKVLQRDITRGSRLLLDTVDEFRDNYEYATSTARASAAPGRRLRPGPAPTSTSTDRRRRGSRSASWRGPLRGRPIWASVCRDRERRHRARASCAGPGLLRRRVAGLRVVSGIERGQPGAHGALDLLFQRRLPVRDAATRDGKEVRVATEGAEVLIDKTVADGLWPMLHMVRNAVVHGIEPTSCAEPAASRCSASSLAARRESGQIVIEVRDDGAGLDLEALGARGVSSAACRKPAHRSGGPAGLRPVCRRARRPARSPAAASATTWSAPSSA